MAPFQYAPSTINELQPLQAPAQQQQQQQGGGQDYGQLLQGLAGMFGQDGGTGGGFEASGIDPSNFSLMGGGQGGAGAAPSLMGQGGGEIMAGTGDVAGGMFGGGGGAAGGSGGSSLMNAASSAGPWAALAAVILGNESYARDRGYRDESKGQQGLDILSGETFNQDLNQRWLPQIGIEEDSKLSGIAQMFSPSLDIGKQWDRLKEIF